MQEHCTENPDRRCVLEQHASMIQTLSFTSSHLGSVSLTFGEKSLSLTEIVSNDTSAKNT